MSSRVASRRALLLPAAATFLPLPSLAQTRQRPAKGAPATPPPAGSPASTPLGPLDTLAKQALIVDYDTGAVLLEKNADDRMHPSSMSKLMTMYVVFDLLKKGRLQLTQEFPVSERAWKMGGSKMFVQLGSSVPVEALLRGVIVQSGNDACIVLAEGISGSEQQFVDLLNQKAKELGLTNSTFRNATGWPDPEHLMTCRDLARLAGRIAFGDQ
jgi:D-alanyl-D-alanine carboxypeptidase (penicillin-binding protein 5/6)